jgi:hypothetical protein
VSCANRIRVSETEEACCVNRIQISEKEEASCANRIRVSERRKCPVQTGFLSRSSRKRSV